MSSNGASSSEVQYEEAHANQSLQPSLIACWTVGLVLPFIAVGFRFLARYKSGTRYGWDDFFIVWSLLMTTGFAIAAYINVAHGEGKHMIFVTDMRAFIEGLIAAVVAYAIGTVFNKVSILCFYCRCFPSRKLRWAAWGISIFVCLYNIALCIIMGLECIPLKSMWSDTPGHCIDIALAQAILGIVNIVTDAVILSIPIRYVIPLKMSLIRKLQICGIFLTGTIVLVFGILRVVAVAQAPPGDPSYNESWSGIASYCELFIGVIAACLPTMGILFTKAYVSSVTGSARRLLSKTFSKSSSKATSGAASEMSAPVNYAEPSLPPPSNGVSPISAVYRSWEQQYMDTSMESRMTTRNDD